VTGGRPSYYKTLAQDDSIESFLIGVNSDKRYEMMHIINTPLEKTFEQLIEAHADKADFIDLLSPQIYDSLNKIDNFEDISTRGEKGVLRSIAVMGLNEMTEYAENLITLQSLKRKYDLDNEYNATVGGPTDVALITKFEGFHWISLKGTKFSHNT
jgi:hypothetical protein